MPEDGMPTTSSSPYPYREPSPADGTTQPAEQGTYGIPGPTAPLYPYREPSSAPSPVGNPRQNLDQASIDGTMAPPPTVSSPMPAPYGSPSYSQYGQQVPYGGYPQPQGQPMPFGQAPSPQRPKSRRGMIIGIIGAFVATAVVILLVSRTGTGTGTPTPTPSSLVTTTATLPANPRGNESNDVWAKVMDPTMTDEEHDMLLRLEGSLDKAVDDLPRQKSVYPSVHAYIDAASSRRWLGENEGWGTPETCPQNPQLWVRLAMMSRDWTIGELGGKWEVVDFSYPIGQEGEGGHVVTRLVGTSDDVIGMAVDVEYHRWEAPPRFAFAEGTREAAEENHRRLGQVRGKLDAYAKDLGHEVVLQGGERPAVIVNARGTEDNDDYYDIQRQEKLTEVTQQVSRIMRDAGYETGDVLVIPWDDDAWAICHAARTPVSRLRWKYALSEGDYDPYYGLNHEVSPDEARVRLASGLYDVTGEAMTSDARASWDAKGNVRVLAADLSGSVYGENPDTNAERIFEKSEVSVDGLPQQIGGGDNVMYGFLSWPGAPKPNSALWVFYGYDGKEPSVEIIKRDDQSAILFKQVGSRMTAVPKRIPPKDADTHAERLPDGTEVTIYEHTATWKLEREGQEEAEDWLNDEAEDWAKAASWSRMLDDGETYAYLVLLYENVPDEEIYKVAEQVR